MSPKEAKLKQQQMKPPYPLSPPSTINESGRTHLTSGRAANQKNNPQLQHLPKKMSILKGYVSVNTSYLVSQMFMNPAAKRIVVLC